MSTVDADRSISAKWGKRLAAIARTRREGVGGFIPVLRCFLRLYHVVGLSPTEMALILHLMDSKWDSDHPKVKSKIIAERMGISVPQLKRYIRNLERLGLQSSYDPSERMYTFDLDVLFEKFADTAESVLTERMKSNLYGQGG